MNCLASLLHCLLEWTKQPEPTTKPNEPIPMNTTPQPMQKQMQKPVQKQMGLEQEAEQWRKKAFDLAHQKAELAKASQEAYQNGDKQAAHDLSVQSKALAPRIDEAHEKASQMFFEWHNHDNPPDELDLHGQLVKEALDLTRHRLQACQSKGETKLIVITGKGLHSVDGIAKIKPSLIAYLKEQGLSHEVDQPHAGCILIHIQPLSKL